MSSKGFEPGSAGQLISLSGRKGKQYQGRKTDQTSFTEAAGIWENVLSANPDRIWLIIQNRGVGDLGVAFGATPAGASFVLQPMGALVIDQLLPWTGPIGYISSAAVLVTQVECSLAAT